MVTKLKAGFFRLARYLIVAVTAYVMDMLGYICLLYIGVGPLLSNMTVKILSAIFTFFAHRYFTYQIKHNNGLLGHAIKYFTLVVIYVPMSSISLLLMLKIIHDPVIAKFICDVILFIAVYWITTKIAYLQSSME